MRYKIEDQNGLYFLTMTIVEWIDLFTRPVYKDIVIESLKYCQKEKGLEIYAYCIMSNHLHLLCKSVGKNTLAAIMRDFKKFTSKKIIHTVINEPESRREWLLDHFAKACEHLKRAQKYKVWQNGYHAEIAYSNTFLKEKINYIHNNPVKDKIVQFPEHYMFSSARNYASLDYELKVEVQHELLL